MNKFLLIAVLLIAVFASNAQGNVPTLPPQAKPHAVKFAPTPTPVITPPTTSTVNLAVMPFCNQGYFYVVNTGDTVSNVNYTVFGIDGGFIWGGIIPTLTGGETKMILIPSGGQTVFVNASGKTFIGTC